MTPDNLNIDLIYAAGDWSAEPEIEMLANKAIAAAVETAHLKYLPGAELSIILSDDDHLRALNNEWRKIDKPTNVLSFPVEEIEPGDVPGLLLGDIVIAYETLNREAELFDKPFADHFTHLAIHGFLHIFGYDHIDDTDAELMEDLERRCMDALGLPDPYLDVVEDTKLQPVKM